MPSEIIECIPAPKEKGKQRDTIITNLKLPLTPPSKSKKEKTSSDCTSTVSR